MTAASVTDGDDALVIATAAALLRTKKALLRLRALRQLGKIADAHVSPTRVIRFISSNSHFIISLLNYVIVPK
jgi:hypothetical protein